ncbi:uncharacterized protein GJ701_001957 isoform 2-T12 [Geothlypis trichas]
MRRNELRCEGQGPAYDDKGPDRKSIWHLTGIDAHCIKASKMKKFGLVRSLLFIAKKFETNSLPASLFCQLSAVYVQIPTRSSEKPQPMKQH